MVEVKFDDEPGELAAGDPGGRIEVGDAELSDGFR